jgi:Fe-S cluster assembly protein SufD
VAAPATADGPAWLTELRREAARKLHDEGFPNKKDEAWKFTPVAPVTDVDWQTTTDGDAASADWALEQIPEDGSFRIVLVNGAPQLSRAGTPPSGIELITLAEALRSRSELVEPHLGHIAKREHFESLNAALFEDGLVLVVGKDAIVDRPIHLIHAAVPGAEPTAAYPRVLVVAEAGAEVSLIESFLVQEGQKHLNNAVMELNVGPNAKVDHTRITEGRDNGLQVATVAARQAKDSRYTSRVFTFGGALVRVDLDIELRGQGAECRLDGAYHVGGTDHVDHHTVIDHCEPRCSSDEVYRGILDGRGHAVFDGTILVRRDSQHTSAHQENRNLLLSDDARVNTKPHLRIDADDVQCSHGATIGALDEDPLYYLRARGIGYEQASAILTFAFIREVIDRVPQERVRRRLGESLLSRLPYGESIRELL